MAGIVPDFAVQVLYTGIPQHGPHFAHARAVITNRVRRSGNQQHRQILADILCPFAAADMAQGGQHFAVGRRGKWEGAQRVCIVCLYHFRVTADPGIGRNSIRNAVAIGPHIQLNQRFGNIFWPAHSCGQRGNRPARLVADVRTRRAAENSAGDAFRPGFGIPAGVKAAHAVAIQKYRQTGELLVDDAVHRVQVIQQVVTAAGLAIMAVLPFVCGTAVTQVVVAGQSYAALGIPLRHGAVALYILAHAVAELQHGAHRHPRHGIHAGRHGMNTIGRRETNLFTLQLGHRSYLRCFGLAAPHRAAHSLFYK